ncbi:MAG: tRNA 2-thiocytidine biosynthesis protein TtcA [Clostridiales bacterium]|nr:tRNA 2-thiocytidine biosynthesis protein TtcA [Clostridiales bacterium]
MREFTAVEQIERSIDKKFRAALWKPFITAIKRYELIREGDAVAVCVSGGKDSFLLAKLAQQLARRTEVPFTLRFLTMDPGYNAENRAKVEENAGKLGIPLEIFKTDIFDAVAAMGGSPCYMCARMRRGNLYAKARDMGCNKIALAHHLNDVVETTLMGVFYGAQLQAMLPKLRSANFAGMELIRPLYMVKEDAVRAWRDYNGLEFIRCACRFTEYCSADELENGGGKRQETKRLLRELKKTNPEVEERIFRSIHNVKLDTLPGYKRKGREVSFLDEY